MAVLVAAIMVVATMVPAWAAGASDSGRMTDGGVGSITIDGYDTNENYYAYKILDLASFEDGTVNGTAESPDNANALKPDNHLSDAYAYVILDDSPWEAFVRNVAYNGTKYFTVSDTAINFKNVSGDYFIVTANPSLTGFNNLFNNSHTADETTNEEYTTASVVQYLAQQAYAYATGDTTNSTVTTTSAIASTLDGSTYKKVASNGSITGLDLGYYLVNSTTGTLCALDTTNKAVTVKEKNKKPTVNKTVQEDSGTDVVDGDLIHSYVTQNDADMGQDVYFKHLITVQKGAQNYILHDQMAEGLTFVPGSLEVWFLPNGAVLDNKSGATAWVKLTEKNTALSLSTATDLKSTNGTTVNDYPYNATTGAAVAPASDNSSFYTLTTDSVKYYGDVDGTFKLTFTPAFLTFLSDKMSDSVNSYRLVVGYKAVLNSKATVDKIGVNANKVWLEYGENESGKPGTDSSNESITYTATWSTQILKYTDRINNTAETPTVTETVLDGAHFEIYRGDETSPLRFVRNSAGNYTYDARVQSTVVAAGATAEAITEVTDSEARDGNAGEWTIVTTLTSSSGIINIKGLDGDKYYLKETLAPKGYNQLEGKIPFRIVSVTEAADGALETPGPLKVTYGSSPTVITVPGSVAWSDAGDDHTNPYDTLAVSITAGGTNMPKQIKVENTTSTELPSTGGMGTTVLYIVGGMMVILAGAYLFFSRRRQA